MQDARETSSEEPPVREPSRSDPRSSVCRQASRLIQAPLDPRHQRVNSPTPITSGPSQFYFFFPLPIPSSLFFSFTIVSLPISSYSYLHCVNWRFNTRRLPRLRLLSSPSDELIDKVCTFVFVHLCFGAAGSSRICQRIHPQPIPTRPLSPHPPQSFSQSSAFSPRGETSVCWRENILTIWWLFWRSRVLVAKFHQTLPDCRELLIEPHIFFSA